MKKEISLKKNFLMNVALTMSSFIFPLITFPYASRVLGPAGEESCGEPEAEPAEDGKA